MDDNSVVNIIGGTILEPTHFPSYFPTSTEVARFLDKSDEIIGGTILTKGSKSGKGSKATKSSKGTKSTSKGAKSGVGGLDMGAGTKDGVKCAIMHDNSSESRLFFF